jgi:hypothetical protein
MQQNCLCLVKTMFNIYTNCYVIDSCLCCTYYNSIISNNNNTKKTEFGIQISLFGFGVLLQHRQTGGFTTVGKVVSESETNSTSLAAAA